MDAITLDPHLLDRPLGFGEDLLACAFIHRPYLGDLKTLWVIMHPKIDLHGVNQFFSQKSAWVKHLILGLNLGQLVVDHVDQACLYLLLLFSLVIWLSVMQLL